MVYLAELTLVCKTTFWLPLLGWLRSIKQIQSPSFNVTKPTKMYRKVSVIGHHYFKIGSLFTMEEKCFQIIFCFTAQKWLMSHTFKLFCIKLNA